MAGRGLCAFLRCTDQSSTDAPRGTTHLDATTQHAQIQAHARTHAHTRARSRTASGPLARPDRGHPHARNHSRVGMCSIGRRSTRSLAVIGALRLRSGAGGGKHRGVAPRAQPRRPTHIRGAVRCPHLRCSSQRPVPSVAPPWRSRDAGVSAEALGPTRLERLTRAAAVSGMGCKWDGL